MSLVWPTWMHGLLACCALTTNGCQCWVNQQDELHSQPTACWTLCSMSPKVHMNHLWILINADSVSVDLEWDLKFCSSTSFQMVLRLLIAGPYFEYEGFNWQLSSLLGLSDYQKDIGKAWILDMVLYLDFYLLKSMISLIYRHWYTNNS